MESFNLEENKSAEELYARGSELFSQGNWEGAIPLILEAANMGNADAQNHMGVDYRLGEGVPKDPQKGIEWYRKAVAQNHAKAQLNLGLVYKKGVDLPQDLNEAFRLISLAAEQGFDKAQTNLGLFYENGEVVEQDYATAAVWYQKAAEQGYAPAQYYLACLYSEGLGVTQSFVAAKRLWEAAAAQGHKMSEKALTKLNKLIKFAIKYLKKTAPSAMEAFDESQSPELLDAILLACSETGNAESATPAE